MVRGRAGVAGDLFCFPEPRGQEMTMLDDVANEILRRCTELMAVNDCQADELAMAQTICHEQRDNPAVADRIAEYTMLADAITDGVFSATLESWRTTKQ